MSEVIKWNSRDATLRLRGRVTIADADDLLAGARKAARAKRPPTIVADELEHLDTAGAQVLLTLRHALRAAGRDLQWRGLPDPVRAYLASGGFLTPLGVASPQLEPNR